MNPKISIIVPIYNTEKYLTNCINSIINQSYKNLEIILVNDASTDNSLNICKEFQEEDKRIVLFDIEHSGVSKARNCGLDNATGDYIGFVDSDDYIEPNMFETLIKAIKKYSADISMCKKKSCRRLTSFSEIKEFDYIEYTSKQALEQLLLDKDIGNYVTIKLFKKELFENIRFPVNRTYEDILTTYKLFIKSKKIIYIPQVLYHYYQRDDSICNDITKESILSFLNAIFERYDYLKKSYKGIELYNVYSIVNVVIKMSYWAIGIKKDEIYDKDVYPYIQKVLKEVDLVDEKELIKIMSRDEKKCYPLLKLHKKYLKAHIKDYYKTTKKKGKK